MFQNKVSWLAQHGGTLRYLGGSVTVCTWDGHFSISKSEKQSVCLDILLRVMTSTQMHVGTFLPKTDHNIIRASYGDVTMTLGI